MNWAERIEAAKIIGTFSDDDTKLAISWVTCACGEQDRRIPRSRNGEPNDLRLSDYGCGFFSAVVGFRPIEAASLLGKIETRATEILSDLE